jgi:DNA-binding beta-propeller fold protein YncE
MMKTRAVVPSLAALAVLAGTASAQVLLDSPASVAWHEPTRAWFVANSGRPAGSAVPEGWIARLDGGDKKAEPVWVKGLRAPRGMAAVGGKLYVADATDLVVVDIATRSVDQRLPVRGARLLHGVAADAQGTVYVSDMLRNVIYRVAPGGTPEAFLTSDRLQGPTGLAVEGEHLIVATWGAIADPKTLATRAPGRLLRVDLRSKALTPIGPAAVGNLDGLVVKDGTYFVTDRMAGTLLSVTAAGETKVLRSGLRGPAGIGFAARRRVVGVPERDARNVVFLTLD